jgi:hypothetical protein
LYRRSDDSDARDGDLQRPLANSASPTEISRGIDKWLWFVEAHVQHYAR